MHALPDRIDARGRDHRPDHRPRAGGRADGNSTRLVRHDEIWIALRAGRLHALSCAERARLFPRGVWRRASCPRRGVSDMAWIGELDLGTPAPRPAAVEKLVTLIIDGESVSVPEGSSIMRAAALMGTTIP